MKIERRMFAVLVLLLAASPVAFARGNQAEVRVVHASPDAPVVDVLVNDTINAFPGVAFGEVSDYAPLDAGVYNAKVVPTGAGPESAVIDADLNLMFNRSYTVLAVDFLGGIEPLVLEDEVQPTSVVKSRVRFVHASPDAPPVDIKVVDGPFLFRDVSFKGVGEYMTVPAGSYDLEVRLAGTDVVALSLPGVSLLGGTTYTVIAAGLAEGFPELQAIVAVDAVNPAIENRSSRPVQEKKWLRPFSKF